MPEYILGSRTITLRPADVIGKGGEADIYRKGGEAFKVFKPPSHPDLSGSPALQQEARARIAEHQQKLPSFPRNLPKKVAAPGELLRDKGGMIAGYKMDFIENVEVLLRYGERSFRDQGISDDTVRTIFIDLYKTVEAVHKAQVVIGDFNDLNVLVRGTDAYLIDADSMQFGKFTARMFTAKFVDPLVCDPKAPALMMTRPHSPDTDWYAYLIMLMQSLLFVGPYGGVYRPKDPKLHIAHDARPLRRITVFDPEVRYPKPARSYSILPDTLLQYLQQTFVKDKRGMPPLSLVENLRFTTCHKCGAVHARGQCPVCVGVAPIMVKEVHMGTVKGTKVFETSGPILFTTMQDGNLRYLYFEDGTYKREGGRAVLEGPLEPNLRFRISGTRTLLARGTNCHVFGGPREERLTVDSYGMLPLIDANEENVFFARDGALMRDGDLGLEYPEHVGDVLPNQTLFWVGDELGFGFYRAAELSSFFIFRPAYRGLNDSLKLPPLRGQLIDSTCCLADKRVWFFTSTQEGVRAVNRCYLLDNRGVLLGTAEGTPGDGSWLGSLRGKCAAGNFLLAPTDDGVVRVVQNGDSLNPDREYPDTARFVDSGSHLFINKDGLHAVGRHEIWKLAIG